jgi:hypothetical protein
LGTQVRIKSEFGEASVELLGMCELESKKYAIVKHGMGGYIHGVFTKYAVVPITCVLRSEPLENSAEIVRDSALDSNP